MAAASNRITAVYCVFWGGMMNPNFRLHEATLQSFLHHYHLTGGAQLQQSSLELRPITSTCRNLPFATLNPAAGHGIGVAGRSASAKEAANGVSAASCVIS
jgi:hypothetical protein